MILPGCYNESLIEAIDIKDPVDVALMVDSENSILQEEMQDYEIDAAMAELEANVDTDENDDFYLTSTDVVDVEIDDEIEVEYDLSDTDGDLIDIVMGE